MKTLEFKCEEGEPGYLNWTVPMNAPDQLYYQVSVCFTGLQSDPKPKWPSFSSNAVLHAQQSGLEDQRRRPGSLKRIQPQR